MDAITQDLEIWLICSTTWPTKILKFNCLAHYLQPIISTHISYEEALEVHAQLQTLC